MTQHGPQDPRRFGRYVIDWRRLNNPSWWTRAKGRLGRLVCGRKPYLRPPSWSNEHSPQTIRKILEHEAELRAQILGDRLNVKLFGVGMLAGLVVVLFYAWLSWIVNNLR